MIEVHPTISIRRQCQLLGVSRASYYREPARESPFNLQLMRLIDEQYTKTPFYGYPKMTIHLRELGYQVNKKRVARLMQLMGLPSGSTPPAYQSSPSGASRLSLFVTRS